MEAVDPPLDSPTVSKVLTALLDLRKTFSTPYLKRTKLPKTLTDSHIKKILEQLQSTEKQCSDVIGVAQHLGSQLQSRLQETGEWRETVEILQRRVGELEGLTVTQAAQSPLSPQRSMQDLGETEQLRGENERLGSENDTLRKEVSGLKFEIRRLRREFAQCETPKDQLKKQFFEFGLPLELQADIKTLEAKSKQQADALACQSLQLSEITQLCESLQAQLQGKTTAWESVSREKEELEGRVKQAVQGAASCEKQLKEVKFELMQERFLRERLNRELHGVEIAEAEVQTELSATEISVQTDRFEADAESQTEANTGEMACQAAAEVVEKEAMAVAITKDEISGETISVVHAEVQLHLVDVETLEEGEQTEVDCCEKDTEIRVETEELSVQTVRFDSDAETQTEGNTGEMACQAVAETVEKEASAVAIMKDENSGEILLVQHAEVQQTPASVDTLEQGEQTRVECYEKDTEMRVETREIGVETEGNTEEVETRTKAAATICTLEGCRVEGLRKRAELAFVGSICVPYQPPKLEMETFKSGEVICQLEFPKAEDPISPSETLALSFDTIAWASYSASSPTLRLEPQSSISLQSSPKPAFLSQPNPIPALHLLTQTWADIPSLPVPQYIAEVREKNQQSQGNVQRNEVACEARPEVQLFKAEKCSVLPVKISKKLEMSVLKGEFLMGRIEPQHIATDHTENPKSVPVLSLHTTQYCIPSTPALLSLVSLPAFTLCGPLLPPKAASSLSIEPLPTIYLAGLTPPDTTLHSLPVQSVLPSPRSLTLSAGPACSLQPSSLSTPSLNTQESEGDWGLETCGIINIYPEITEDEIELFSFTICDIMPIETETAEMTLVSQAILDLPGVTKEIPSLHISRIAMICDQPAIVAQKRPFQVQSHINSLNLSGQPRARPMLSLLTLESIYVEGFNFRQLFVEAIEEEGKGEEGGRRRTRRRVTRKDPGEEYFTMVIPSQCLQAMKLNSPDIQAVQKAEQASLYMRASEAGIPFYKVRNRQWQGWLQGLLLPKAR